MNRSASSTPSRSTTGASVWTAIAVIVLLVGLAWSNTFRAPFELDDDSSIGSNPTIRNLASFHWLTPPAAHGETVSGRPVLNVSFAVDYTLGGLDVRWYHTTNLLIHLAAALTLFGLVRRTLRLHGDDSEATDHSTATAFACAAIWAVHPLQTQTVTYVVQRAESLMSLFYLLTLYGFVRAYGYSLIGGSRTRESLAQSPTAKLSRVQLLSPVLSVIACLLGMATKENMVSAPIAVLLFDRAFVAGSYAAALRRRPLYYIALAATWVLLAVLVASTGGNRGGSAGFDVGVGWFDYVLTQFPAFVRYAALAVWPHPLVFEYGPYSVGGLSSVAGPALLVILALAASAYALWRAPRVGFVAFVGWAVLAPTSLVPGTLQMIVEHRMYLPLAAVVVLLVAALRPMVRARHLSSWLVGAVVVALAILTFARNRTYRSELTLWQDTVAKAPANPRAHNNLGLALLAAGRNAEAVAEFRRTIELQPNHAFARTNLGNALLAERRWGEAAEQFAAALAADPHFVNARINLGVALTQLGRKEEAIAHYRAALADDPNANDARTNLAGLLVDQGKLQEAERLLDTALKASPELQQAHYQLGRALEIEGRLQAADAEYREALRLKPTFAEAHLAVGNRLASEGDVAAAEAEYRQAIQLDGQFAEARYALGNVLAQRQQFAAAMAEYRVALALDPDHEQARTNLANCQLMVGDVAGAIANYEEVLRTHPDNPSARRNLNVARQMQRQRAH